MEKIAELIPAFFYDLIARICPGILIGSVILIDPRVQPIGSKIPTGILVLILIIFGYICGFLMDEVTQLPYILGSILSSFVTKRRSTTHQEKKDVWSLDVWAIIDSAEGQDKTMMTKYMAELSLCRVLTLSWLILWIIQIDLMNNISAFLKLLVLFILIYTSFNRDLVARRVALKYLRARSESKI